MVYNAEIPLGVDPATSSVDGEGWRQSSATPWDPVSKVLREIIVRLGFPTSLVRATLVCKRCLCHASDPAFLRRFRRLQDGVWTMHTSATTEFHGLPLSKKLLLVANKVYICAASYTLVFDLTDLSFSKIQYPQEVGFSKVIMLSQADDDYGLYLIHAKEFQLGISLHKGDNWLMVDNICLREMYADLRISENMRADEHKVMRISQVGPNTEFVFLQVGRFILYFDIKFRMLCKVYEMTMIDRVLGHSIHPFMIWPPTFPALKDDHARDAM